jgi:hypothetical protein
MNSQVHDMCPSRAVVRPVRESTLALIDRNVKTLRSVLACAPLDILEVTAVGYVLE